MSKPRECVLDLQFQCRWRARARRGARVLANERGIRLQAVLGVPVRAMDARRVRAYFMCLIAAAGSGGSTTTRACPSSY
jgi:hypothetical protein